LAIRLIWVICGLKCLPLEDKIKNRKINTARYKALQADEIWPIIATERFYALNKKQQRFYKIASVLIRVTFLSFAKNPD
jgi:hypothetical protein